MDARTMTTEQVNKEVFDVLTEYGFIASVAEMLTRILRSHGLLVEGLLEDKSEKDFMDL